MIVHLSSLSSFLDDGCHRWYEERGIGVSLLGSLANDKTSINRILDGEVTCCSNFMWDSGAVSVRNKKTEITLDMFVSWVKNIHKSNVPVTVVGLDVIGDPEASQRNFLDLKYKYGLGNGFLPVFHYGEDIHYLDFLIQEGFTYVGLGGVGAGDRLGQTALRDWLRTILFVNGDGATLRYPGVKFHGFAMTSEKTLQGFPLYSVDSATWVKNSAIGKILTPWGDWRVSDDPRSGYDTQHIKRAAPKTITRIRDWVESLGIDWAKVPDGRYEKHIINTNYFKWIENTWEWKPVIQSQSVLSRFKPEEVKPKISLAGFEPPLPSTIVEVQPTTEEQTAFDTHLSNQIAEQLKQEQMIFHSHASKGKISSDMLTKLPQPKPTPVEAVSKIESSPVDVKLIEPKPKVEAKAPVGIISAIICPHCLQPIVIQVRSNDSQLLSSNNV